MMHRKNSALFSLLFGLLLLLGTSCNVFNKGPENLDIDADFNEITVKGDYALKVPKYTSENLDLHEEASLQYANLRKEFYIIVIDEPKDTLLQVLNENEIGDSDGHLSDRMLFVQTSGMDGAEEVKDKTEPKTSTINGLEASSLEMVLKVEGIEVPVAYFITCIEGDQNAYTLMGWTQEKQRDKYRDTFEKMANSFKLVGR